MLMPPSRFQRGLPRVENANRGSIYHLYLPPAIEVRFHTRIGGGVIGSTRAGWRGLSAPVLRSPRS